MSGHQTATVGDTVYFWFAANDTSGSGGDGATPTYDVRIASDASTAAPTLSGTPSLLSHANYPAGCHQIDVAATVGNGFAADDTFAVFCSLAIDAQNPTGFVGSCTLTPLAKAANLVGTIASGTHVAQTGDSYARIGAAGASLTNLGNSSNNWNTVTPLTAAGVRSAVGLASANMDTQFTASATATGFATPTNITSASGITLAAATHTGAVIPTVTTLTGHTAQTGDSYARIGAPVGASISADIATVDTVADGIQTDLSNATDGLGALKAACATATGFATPTNITAGTITTVTDVTNPVTANTTQIAGSTTAATNLSASAAGIITGTTSGTPTTTSTNSDLTGYADSELVGRVIIFTGGTANGQASDITAYTSTSGVVTYTAIQTAPVANDSFVIV